MKSHHHIFGLHKKRLQKKDYKRQKSLTCRRKYYKKQKEEKKGPLFETLHLDSKKKHSLTYSSIGVDNRLGVLTDLHFRFVFCFLLLCLFRLLHGLQFAAGCLGFFFIFFIFFLLKRSLLCYCSLLLSKDYKQCRQENKQKDLKNLLYKK